MKKLFTMSLLALFLTLTNCKDETTEPEKTLDKTKLTNKYWRNPSGLSTLYFRNDGKYCAPNGTSELGTWQWLNNSDSLGIDFTDVSWNDEVWYVKYCTETEMSAKLNKKGVYQIYTKQ